MFENKHRITKGIEELTFFDAFYWSIITAGTVGYGDIVPFTTAGRLLAIVDSLLVIVLLGVLAGLILSYLSPRST
jgi:voltage-gated potassium channel